MNESYCIGLETSVGSRFSGLEKKQGLLFLWTRWTDLIPTLASAHSAGRRASVQSSLLSHLMWCMIIQQMEASANYLLLLQKKQKNNNTFAVLLRLCGVFSTFCCCCFCLSSLRSTFPKWCTLWECLFCAVARWILCMGVVYLTKKQNKTMKPLNAWFGIPFLKGYSVFKTTPPLQSTKTCSVNKARC